MKKIRLLFIFFAAALFLASCGPKPRTAYYLAPDAAGLAGYSANGAESVFESKNIRAAARQVRKNDVSDPLLSSLLEKDYIIFSMTLENRSGSRVIYKPNYTTVINKVDYLKPLDYTDLYELGGEAVDDLKGKFFDLDVTLAPGAKTTGLLIFLPVSKEARAAILEVRELYVGTETTVFSLPFKMQSEPS